MKGEITFKVLNFLGDTAYNFGDLFLIFTAPYGSSYHQIKRHIEVMHNRGTKSFTSIEKQRFYELVHHLRKDGLIAEQSKRGTRFFALTDKGRRCLGILKERLGFPPKQYKKQNEKALKIITFDIPEIEKNKREWLRQVLINLDFKMLQKSVWIGTAMVPIEFMQDLRRLKLINKVEIFTVGKVGTLKKFYQIV